MLSNYTPTTDWTAANPRAWAANLTMQGKLAEVYPPRGFRPRTCSRRMASTPASNGEYATIEWRVYQSCDRKMSPHCTRCGNCALRISVSMPMLRPRSSLPPAQSLYDVDYESSAFGLLPAG